MVFAFMLEASCDVAKPVSCCTRPQPTVLLKMVSGLHLYSLCRRMDGGDIRLGVDLLRARKRSSDKMATEFMSRTMTVSKGIVSIYHQ